MMGSPSYIAISHTWGRWQITHEENTLYATVPGVPWKVPRNSKFDVESLRMILKQLSNATRYAWLDLLCIPQDRSGLTSKEIARQAAIFKNASKCLTWINDINGWHTTKTAITWLCSLCLQFMADDLCRPAVRSNAELLDIEASTNILELCMRFPSYEDNPGHVRGTGLVTNA